MKGQTAPSPRRPFLDLVVIVLVLVPVSSDLPSPPLASSALFIGWMPCSDYDLFLLFSSLVASPIHVHVHHRQREEESVSAFLQMLSDSVEALLLP